MGDERRSGRFGGRREHRGPAPVEAPDPAAASTPDAVERPGYRRFAIDPGAGPQMILAIAGAIGGEMQSDRIRFVNLPELAGDSIPDITLAVNWPGMSRPSGVEVLEVGADRLMVVTRVAPPSGSTRLSPGDLRGLDLIVGPTGPHDDRILAKILGQPAYRPQVRHHFDDTVGAVAMLESADAFMVMPQRCTGGLPRDLTVLPLGPTPLYVTVQLLVDAAIAADEEALSLIVRIHSAAEGAAQPGHGIVATVDLRPGRGAEVPGGQVSR